jgi:capsular polysaccharide export protein
MGDKKPYAPGNFKNTLITLFNAVQVYTHSDKEHLSKCQCTVVHYLRDKSILMTQATIILYSILGIRQVYFVEPSFISGIIGQASEEYIQPEYQTIYSYIIDDMGFYFDSKSGSRVEQYLNTKEFSLSTDEKKRCFELIQFIVRNKITKYNFQSLNAPEYMKQQGKKVLVVDQTFVDASILRGGGSNESFDRMLMDAMKEHPDATVIVKSHPDTHLQKKNSYYEGLAISPADSARIVMITAPVNPYVLLEGVDVVYTCTSQLGFEALMAGKKVKTYGMPIYAGWGLTEDTLSCPRRKSKRSVEEVFYALYVAFATHIDPFTLERCTLEQYLESLLILRNKYFKSHPK